MAKPPRQARRCTARRSTDGQPCRAWAIVGGTVCRSHGGSAPQVLLAAGQEQVMARARAFVRRELERQAAVAYRRAELIAAAAGVTVEEYLRHPTAVMVDACLADGTLPVRLDEFDQAERHQRAAEATRLRITVDRRERAALRHALQHDADRPDSRMPELGGGQ
jgi:hypothetical protein